MHNLAATLEVQKNFSLTAGVNNLTNKKPYLASSAYPVSGIGRTLFISARANF